ncbi:uncharacterized protein si:ch73-347e22.4 [Triplophysa dalaica]|uniref:uncharacterized protein si:ch73-347e22.4 n=1 Tax=Triplophysa dalaica TaxID=1582913 RepID=UPI0024DF84F4|nr:uncharacterized protein si:ch73-347e22.4 [Triplophysa dalaica]
MDGKLPPWNIHGSHSSSIPYASGECQEGRDFIGESMPSLSSCMSGAFRALLPDYHGTSSTTNCVKYSYSPDDHCVIRSGAGMSYIENTIERREKLDFMKDDASVTHTLPLKCTQYVPQEQDREMDHGNTHNWTTVIKDALEMSNGMEIGQTLSANVCGPLVDLNPVYKVPQYKELEPNENQDGREVKRGQDPLFALLSEGISKRSTANVQEMVLNQRTNIFAEGCSLSREELGVADIRGHESVSLPGYYRSHTPHSFEGCTRYDEFSGSPFVKQHEEPALQKTPQEPGLSCSHRKTTKICFKDAKVNHETVSDNSAICGLHNFDAQEGSLQTEVTDGNTSVNSQPYPSNYNDQEEMVHQCNLQFSDTNSFVSRLDNNVSTSPKVGWIDGKLSKPVRIETKGSVNTTNTELNLKVQAKFAPEIVSFSNHNSSSVSEIISERSAFSNKMHTDDECKDSIQEQSESDKVCFQENHLKSETVTLESKDVKTDVCDLHVEEKQYPADQGTALAPSGVKTQNSESCEQTLLNNAKESSYHSTLHNLQNILQKYKKTRKQKKSELEKLNGWIDKSTKIGHCSLHDSETLAGAVKQDESRCELAEHDMTTLERDNLLKYDVNPPSQSGKITPKKSKIMPVEEHFVTPSNVPELPCVSLHQPERMADTAETSQNPVHSSSEGFHEKQTPDAGKIIQMDNRNKPSQPVRKAIYGRKRKRISKSRLKAKISTILSVSQSNMSSLEEHFTSHSQVISSLQSSNIDCKQAISRKSPNKKTLQTIDEAQHTLQSSEDSPQTSKDCQTGTRDDIPISLEADHMGFNVKKLQKARRPAIKAFVDKNDTTSLLNGESLVDSVSQTDSTSPTDSSNIQSPQNNQRKPRQKKRADVNEAAETFQDSPALFQQEHTSSPLSKLKENMEMTKATKSVKGKRPLRKNVSDDHETALLDVQTFAATLEQDLLSTAESEASGKKVSKSAASLLDSSPEKTMKARRYSKNHLNSCLAEETSLLSTVSQENSISPLKIDSSSRPKKSRKKTVTKIKDEEEQTIEVNHTAYQQEDLSEIPDPIIASSAAQITLKSKIPAKKGSSHQLENEHPSALWNMQKQEDCVPTSFVHTTPKKSKKVSDIKDNAMHIPTDDQTMPQQNRSSLLQESEASIVPLKKRRFRTPQTLVTNYSLYTASSVHSNEVISPAIGNPAPVTETDYFNVFNQQNIVKMKRSTKKVTRRKKNMIQAISSFEELSCPPTEQKLNSVVTREKKKNPTLDHQFEKDIVNGTASQGESRMFVSTEDVTSIQSSPKKPKKNWLKQIEKNEPELHHSITETANNFKPAQEVDTLSNLPSFLKESVSVTSEPNSFEQKWKAAKRKSNRSKLITETNGFCVSLSEKTLYHTKIKTEAVETDVMVTHRNVQNFSDGQTVKELQSSEKDGSEVDQKDGSIKHEPTLKRPKLFKAPKKKKRKAAKNKRKIPHRIKKEHEIDTTYNRIACDVHSQISDNTTKTSVLPEEPVMSNMFISRKSTRIGIINSCLDVKTASDQVNSTATIDITESSTRLKESLSSSVQAEDCKELNNVPGILIKTMKRGRPRKHKLPVAHLEENIQVSDLFSCQDSTENTIQTATNPVKLNVVQHLKKKRGRKMKKMLSVKQLETDPSQQSVTEPSNTTSSQSVCRRGRKKKNLKAPGRNIRLSYLRVSSRISDQGKAETPSIQQNSTEVLKKVSLKTSRRGTGMKQKLSVKTTIQEEVVTDVKIEQMNRRKPGRRGRPRKVRYFDDLQTQLQPTQQLNDEMCGLLPSNLVKEEEPEHILLDAKIKACTHLRSEKTPETEIANTVVKVDGFTQYSEKHVAMPNKKIVSKTKENTKKPLTCKYCGVSFRHITAFVMHRRIHTGEKPYNCKSCGKTFAQLSKLKSHQNVHKQSDAFPCPCCNQTFSKRQDLLCHFKVHLQEVKTKSEQKERATSSVASSKKLNVCHVCKICKKNFVSQVKLHTHMEVHEAEKPWTCKDCGKRFWKSCSLAVHEKSHWPVKPYACSICGKGFHLLKALKKHSREHTGETPFSCSHCGHAFSALSALRMHQASKTCVAKRSDGECCDVEGFIVSQGAEGQVNTPVFFKCQICKQLFKKWCQYTLHLQTHTSSSPYLCFSCGQCYEKGTEVNVHCEVCCQSSGEEKTCGGSVSEIMQRSELRSNNASDSLQCTGEGECTQVTNDLPEFLRRDAHESPIQRPTAQSPARSEISCTSSLECIEISPSLWKFQCSRCGQRFERYRTLCAHMHTHAPAFRYTCAHCGQSFERWSKLWLHQRRHLVKGRCYSCAQCSLQFRFFSSYKEHMFEHAGQRPYACPLCPETFIQEESLHAHQYESHQLRESLKCDVCSKTFSSLRNLVKHSLLHNGSTSHACLLCGLPFTNTRALQQHLNKHAGYYGLPLPDVPSKPLSFPHQCKRCKAGFSTGDLLYAHQICHSRNARTKVRPDVQSTSKASYIKSRSQKNHLSNLKLDGVPSDKSLYVYSHPDRLYLTPSLFRERHPVIRLDSNGDISDSQNTSPDINSNPSSISEESAVHSQTDSTHLPQENINSESSIKDRANDSIQNTNKTSHKHQRSGFVETSINMELETVHEESEESFECADCTEKLTSVLGLYEHYILHAFGDTYVQVH